MPSCGLTQLVSLVVLLFVSLLLVATAAAADPPIQRSVALEGDAAPGTPVGVVFDDLAALFGFFDNPPSLSREGRMFFFGLLSGPGVDDSNDHGLWVETSAGVVLTVRRGDVAPGTATGTVFGSIPGFGSPPPLTEAEVVAFTAKLAGPNVTLDNDLSLWTGSSGALSLLAREGDLAPTTGQEFTGLSVISLDSSGNVYFLAGLGGTPFFNESLWSNRNGTLASLIRGGDSIPGLSGNVFVESVAEVGLSESGQGILEIQLMGPGVDGNVDDEALVVEAPGGGFELLIREGDPVAGAGPGAELGTGVGNAGITVPQINDAGKIVFKADLGGTLFAATAILSSQGGALEVIALRDTPAPGAGFDFFLIGPPLLTEQGTVAFTGSGPDTDGDPFSPPPSGIFTDLSGALDALILPGEIIPGTGVTLDTAVLRGFTSAGQLAFSSPEHGLFLGDAGGFCQLADEAELFDVVGDGSDLRIVSDIAVAGLSESGDLGFRLEFEDGTSGLFVASLSGAELNFVRGDVQGSGTVDLADGIGILNTLFAGGTPFECEDAADTSDDGLLSIVDAISLLNALFVSGSAPIPGPNVCGPDPTDDALGCELSPSCP